MALTWVVGCGEVTEQPSDCTSNEYYDDGLAICLTCPSVELASCPEDCGFVLEDDERGCTIASCSCGGVVDGTPVPGLTCVEGTFFNADLAACEVCPQVEPAACQSCPQVGLTRDEHGCSQPVCACEGDMCPPVAEPECGDEGCCAVVDSVEEGCPVRACSCPAEAPDGFYFDDDAICRTCEGVDPAPEACLPE